MYNKAFILGSTQKARASDTVLAEVPALNITGTVAYIVWKASTPDWDPSQNMLPSFPHSVRQANYMQHNVTEKQRAEDGQNSQTKPHEQ